MADVTRWKLTEEIARGGAGVVWLAYDTQQDRKVAVKFVDAKTFAGEKARKRFLREGQVLTRLEHPNIMPVHEVGGDDAPYLVMDYVAGGSLEDRLERDGPLEPRDAAHIACQMALAIDHAHQAQVIHRDLKPGNVLLREPGEPLVTDFGLAKDLGRTEGFDAAITARGHSLGTPGYWSPEQASGKADRVGPATDIYGIGGTLYAMLTGRPPHEGETLIEVFTSMDSGVRPPQELRPEVDDALAEICLRSLAHEPDDRFPSARALADALEGYLNAHQEDAIFEAAKLRTQCPICGRAIVVAACYEGRRGRCPGCKRLLRLKPDVCAVSLQIGSGVEDDAAPAPPSDPAPSLWLHPPVAAILSGSLTLLATLLAGGAPSVAFGVAALMAALAALCMRWILTPTPPPPPRPRRSEGLVETIRHSAVLHPPEPAPADPLGTSTVRHVGVIPTPESDSWGAGTTTVRHREVIEPPAANAEPQQDEVHPMERAIRVRAKARERDA